MAAGSGTSRFGATRSGGGLKSTIAKRHGVDPALVGGALSLASIERFIPRNSPLGKAGGAKMLLRATGGNLAGAAMLAAIARKESSFGAQAFVPNNFWGYGIHAGPSVNRAPSVEAMASRVWKGLSDPKGYYAKAKTFGQAIDIYAPPSENNTGLYKSQGNQWLKQMGADPNMNFRGGGQPAAAPRMAQSAGGGAGAQGGSGAAGGQLAPLQLDPTSQKLIAKWLKASESALDAGKVPQDDKLWNSLQSALLRAAARRPTIVDPGSTQAGGAVAGVSLPPASTRGTAGGTGIPQTGKSLKALKYGGNEKDHGARALGNWQSDNAYDLMGKTGQPIYSPIGGKIVKVSGTPNKGGGLTGYGITVQTKRGKLFFKHFASTPLKAGMTLKRGQLVGTLDGTVNGGAHVHLGSEQTPFLRELAKYYSGRI